MGVGNRFTALVSNCCCRGPPFHRSVRLGVIVLVLLVVAVFVTREYNVLHYTKVSEYPGPAASANEVPDVNGTVLNIYQNASLAANQTIPAPETSYVAICATAKDQNIDICEWLQYHEQVVGIGMFYIMDHGSSDPLINTIRGCFDVRRIGYHYFNRTASATFKPQMWAYSECLRLYRHRHRWMAFIDIDEFFVLQQKSLTSIDDLLHKYEGYGGVVVNWLIFGSAGHIQRPEGGVMANYDKTLAAHHPQNLHIKSIVNTEWAVEPNRDPHHFRYVSGHWPVNTAFKRSAGPKTAQVKHDVLSLYHYVLKSLEDYKRKASRGSAMGNFKKIQYFQIVDREANHSNHAGQEAVKKMDPHKYDAIVQLQLQEIPARTPAEIMQQQELDQ